MGINLQQLILLKLFDYGELTGQQLQEKLIIDNCPVPFKMCICELKKLRNKGLIITSEGNPFWNRLTIFSLSNLSKSRLSMNHDE